MATIIFDFDGTIADSFEYVCDFLGQDKFGRSLTATEMQELHGMSMVAMARQLGYPWWRLVKLSLKGRRRMQHSITDIPPFAGMPEVIRKLHAEGHELFIVSSNSVRNIHKFLHHHQLHTYFLQVYGGVNVFGKAPAFRGLFKDQNLDIQNAVYVGDELRDIQAAHATNLRIVAVTWGFASPTRLKQEKPTKLVSSPTELIQVLEEF